jgi:hypothetical protein
VELGGQRGDNVRGARVRGGRGAAHALADALCHGFDIWRGLVVWYAITNAHPLGHSVRYAHELEHAQWLAHREWVSHGRCGKCKQLPNGYRLWWLLFIRHPVVYFLWHHIENPFSYAFGFQVTY